VRIVDYKGREFAGRHEALIDEELFDRVQEVVRTRGHSGERRRLHHHFLKGTVYCGECKRVRGVDQRLLLQRAVGRHGGEYYYFFCPNRRDGTCHQPFHDLGRVEGAVERHYKRKRFSAEFIGLVRRMMDEAVSDQDEAQRLLKQQLDEQIDRLDTQEENLIDLAADGELPHDKIKARLFKIQRERQRLTEQAAAVDTDLKAGQRVIDEQLNLLRDAHRLYMQASDENKRRLNQLIYKASTSRTQPTPKSPATTSRTPTTPSTPAKQRSTPSGGRRTAPSGPAPPTSAPTRPTTPTKTKGRPSWTAPTRPPHVGPRASPPHSRAGV